MTSQGARCGPPPHPGAPSLLLSGSTDVEEDQDHLDQGGSAPAAADPAKDPPGLELDVGLLARAALVGTAGNDRHSDHEADGDPDRRTGQRPDRRERRADSGRAPLGYFGGLAAAVGLGLIEPPLAVFSAAVPVFKALTNSALPKVVRTVGEVLEGAAKPVGSDAEEVLALQDQRDTGTTVVHLGRSTRKEDDARHTPIVSGCVPT